MKTGFADWRRADMSLPDHVTGVRPSEEQLRRVVEQHAEAVYRVAITVVHDASLAEDVVQETMLKAWRHSPVPPNTAIPKAWLLKVARNTAISLLRTRREDFRGPDTLPERAAGPEVARIVEDRVKLEELWELMQHLNEDARVLIVLKEVDGLSYDEIALTLDLPLSTVKTRLYRARKALKDALKDWN
jgi:RNA polymerase sigma-70 factor (ECF subfamily)